MSIKNRQNDEKILRLQYSSRHLYNSAEFLDAASWILTIIVILIGWFENDNSANATAYIVAILTVANVIIDYFRKKIICIAAGTRTHIDEVLFDFEPKKIINGFSVKTIEKTSDVIAKLHKKTYYKQITHNGKDKYKGVKDWYTLNNTNNKQDEIISAQIENCSFDKSVSKISECISILVFIVFFICLFKFDNNFLLVCAFLPVTFKICKSIIDYHEYKKIYEEEIILISKLKEYGYNEMQSLQLQSYIDSRRTLEFVTFSVVHKIKLLFDNK